MIYIVSAGHNYYPARHDDLKKICKNKDEVKSFVETIKQDRNKYNWVDVLEINEDTLKYSYEEIYIKQ